MRVAKSTPSCLFGGRFKLPVSSTLGLIDSELRRLQPPVPRHEQLEIIRGRQLVQPGLGPGPMTWTSAQVDQQS